MSGGRNGGFSQGEVIGCRPLLFLPRPCRRLSPDQFEKRRERGYFPAGNEGCPKELFLTYVGRHMYTVYAVRLHRNYAVHTGTCFATETENLSSAALGPFTPNSFERCGKMIARHLSFSSSLSFSLSAEGRNKTKKDPSHFLFLHPSVGKKKLRRTFLSPPPFRPDSCDKFPSFSPSLSSSASSSSGLRKGYFFPFCSSHCFQNKRRGGRGG